MKFINKGEAIKIRKGELTDCHWITLKANETIEVPISVEIPVNAELKEYKGNLIVLFKRA